MKSKVPARWDNSLLSGSTSPILHRRALLMEWRNFRKENEETYFKEQQWNETIYLPVLYHFTWYSRGAALLKSVQWMRNNNESMRQRHDHLLVSCLWVQLLNQRRRFCFGAEAASPSHGRICSVFILGFFFLTVKSLLKKYIYKFNQCFFLPTWI